MPNEIYVTIDRKWFEKNEAKAKKEYKEMFDDDKLQSGYKFDVDADKVNIDADGGTITWEILNNQDDDAPYLSVTFDISNEDWIKLAEMVIKRLNKGKALMESLQD